MPFDISENFYYTGSTQIWKKPLYLTTFYFIVKGAGGGGNLNSASGGGGAYVFANYTYLQAALAYDVEINVGQGGSAPPLQLGGISVGGQPDTHNNGGDGTTLQGLSSGGGGGMTSVTYLQEGYWPIKIIAGGGGGAGNSGGSGGGAGGQYELVGKCRFRWQ
jgi:hypothetical protein